MFEALGRLAFRRRWWLLGWAGVLVALGAVWGAGVVGSLSQGGLEDPGSESALAAERIEAVFGRDDVDVVALYSDPRRTIADPGFRDAVQATVAALPTRHVTDVRTYWSTTADRDRFVSTDRHATYATIQLAGDDDGERAESFAAVRDALDAPGLTTRLGGPSAVFADISAQISTDIARAETLSLPVVFLLLVLVFGSLTAAATPLVVGGLAIIGSLAVVRGLTLVTDMSVFSINVITMLGLGLAIDYALFVVSRFREELVRRQAVAPALVATMATAGRTVAFSGITVAVSLSALLLFPQMFLRSMGLGGMAAVGIAMLGSLTVLPALLAVLGPRVNALRVRRRPGVGDGGGDPTAPPGGGWARLARAVMRRPLLIGAAVAVLLVTAGLPFTGARFGGVDARALPAGAESRVVGEVLVADFPADPSARMPAIVTGASEDDLAAYVAGVDRLPGTVDARVVRQERPAAEIEVGYTAAPTSARAGELVERLRALAPPPGAEVLLGGDAAEHVDLLDSLAARLPAAAAAVAVVTFVLLFAAFGSLVLPVKAIVMNVLSLGASFGAIVWVFQDGHLSGLLGFTSTGEIEATSPILMLAVAFGLSMDYEVFLLSRIREAWDSTGDNSAAVAAGLARTGPIITSAALLFIVVVGAFATSGITTLKMIGLGLAVAIAVDATVVRGLLVPATMRLLGRANWWAPGPLARAWRRCGLGHDRPHPAPGLPAPASENGTRVTVTVYGTCPAAACGGCPGGPGAVGPPLPRARVTVADRQGVVRARGGTDAGGTVRVDHLPEGVYTIAVSAPGRDGATFDLDVRNARRHAVLLQPSPTAGAGAAPDRAGGGRPHRVSLRPAATAARPASSRATGTRNGEQDT